MKTDSETILVVEDEPDLREGLKHNLELDGYRVETAATGTEGLEKATKGSPTLILLDLMLPELSGLELLRRLRDSGQRTPVIILSARGQDRDKVSGLELGADDYVTKPFRLAELQARLRALLRRAGDGDSDADQDVLRARDLTVAPAARIAQLGDRRLELTPKEFDLLELLVRRAGTVVTREVAMDVVWDDPAMAGGSRTLDVHVSSLRRKLGDDPANPRYIHTVRGIGFRFER